MKLKKLLPLASIAGVAAVVAPLVTSCGTKTYSYTFDSAHTPESFLQQMKQIPASDMKEISEVDATKDFLDAVNNDKKILFDELTYATLNGGVIPQNIKSAVADAKIGKIDSKTGECSFEFNFDMELDIDTSIKMAKNRSDLLPSFKVKNLDFVVLYNGEPEVGNNHWWFEPTVCAVWNAARVESYWEKYEAIYDEVLDELYYYAIYELGLTDPQASEYANQYTPTVAGARADSYSLDTAYQFAKFYLRSHNNWEFSYTLTSKSDLYPINIDLTFNAKSPEGLLDVLLGSYTQVDEYEYENQYGILWLLSFGDLYYYKNVNPIFDEVK